MAGQVWIMAAAKTVDIKVKQDTFGEKHDHELCLSDPITLRTPISLMRIDDLAVVKLT
jgi:hypothetical protein